LTLRVCSQWRTQGLQACKHAAYTQTDYWQALNGEERDVVSQSVVAGLQAT